MTYDQQSTATIARGNGDAALHAVRRERHPEPARAGRVSSALYDNTYDVGTNSAEGHNWLMQGDNPEYTESSAGGYLAEDDVLGHQKRFVVDRGPGGLGEGLRNGEFTEFQTEARRRSWQQYWMCVASKLARAAIRVRCSTRRSGPTPESPIPSPNPDHRSRSP